MFIRRLWILALRADARASYKPIPIDLAQIASKLSCQTISLLRSVTAKIVCWAQSDRRAGSSDEQAQGA